MIGTATSLSPLIEELDRIGAGSDWSGAHAVLERFVEDPAAVLGALAADTARLSAEEFQRMAARSREVSTHYAWCVFDDQRPYSVWINEYKPQRDWLRGYANVVHNHRYAFTSAILHGRYTEELFAVTLGADNDEIVDVAPLKELERTAGSVRTVEITEFHRIPTAADGTVSLLVKSAARQPHSMSFDPDSRSSRTHVPIEQRQNLLVERLA